MVRWTQWLATATRPSYCSARNERDSLSVVVAVALLSRLGSLIWSFGAVVDPSERAWSRASVRPDSARQASVKVYRKSKRKAQARSRCFKEQLDNLSDAVVCSGRASCAARDSSKMTEPKTQSCWPSTSKLANKHTALPLECSRPVTSIRVRAYGSLHDILVLDVAKRRQRAAEREFGVLAGAHRFGLSPQPCHHILHPSPTPWEDEGRQGQHYTVRQATYTSSLYKAHRSYRRPRSRAVLLHWSPSTIMAPISWKPSFETEPPSMKYAVLSFPSPAVLLVRLNRPKALNCINSEGHAELQQVWDWLDAEPSLRVGIITGTGRAFCAGADLKGTLQASRRTRRARDKAKRTQSGTTRMQRVESDPCQHLASARCPEGMDASRSLRR